MSKARVLSVLSSNLAADASLPSTSLATVNSNVGSFGSATAVPIVIVNAKGLVTAVSTASITVPTLSSQLTNDSGFATETYVDTAIGLNVPLTGTGASGTWNIGITGNASTVTDITSSQVTTALGFTPYNATNPNGYTTNVGTLTAVTATGPIASTGGTTPVISMPAATTTVDGHLTAADWTIFNNKQVAGTYATGTGSASGTNTGDNAVNSLYSGLVTNATHTGDVTGSDALTLATVNTNVGQFGSTTAIPVVTVNGKGLITAISTTSITVPTLVSQLSNDSSFATTTYVGTAIANLVDSSPAALDTLNELAAALGNDASFAATTATNLGLKALKTTTISAGAGLTGGGDLGADRTLALTASGVAAGTYNNVTVDTYGRATSGSNVAYITGYTEVDTLATVTARGSQASASITIGSNGTYAAGSIYSDSNWGMLFRARQASPASKEFMWSTSTDTNLMTLSTAGALNAIGAITGSNLSGTNTGDNPGVTSVAGVTPIISSGGTTPSISHATSGATAGTYNSVTINTFGHVTAGSNVDTTEWYHSDRNFPNGTLITTSIDYSVSNGDPFVLEIRGNSYGNIIPLDMLYQGYIYSDTIINHGGLSNGLNISGLVVLNVGGNLCFWFPDQGYWNGYNVKVYTAYATRATNRVTSITGTTKPAGTKEVALSANIRQSLHSGNYTSYAPTLTGGSASGTWGINVTGTSNNITAYNINQNLGTGYGPTFANVYNDGWFRTNASGNGMYNQTTGQHWYSDSTKYWNMGGGNINGQGIRFRDTHAGTVRGYIHYDQSNNIGFLNQNETWKLRVVDGDYTLVEGSSMRAPIFYDSDNTAYYLNPNSNSYLNSLSVVDGNLQLYKHQIVDMSNTSTYSVSNYYPILISVPTAGAWIEVQNNLNSNVPSWSTHPGGFTLNLRWRTNGYGWGTTEVKRRVEQYHERFTNYTICGGISQLGNSNQEVVWLRGGGTYFFKFSRDLTATPQSIDYTASGETAAVRTTAFNAVWDSATGAHNSYNTTVYADSLMSSPIFYDRNDTSYYVDPNSGSTLSSLTVVNTITGSISGTAAGETLATVTGRGASTSAAISLSGTLSFAQPVGLSFANGQYIKDNGGGGLAIYSGAAINLTGATSVTGALTVSTTATAATLIGTSAVQVGSATAKGYGVLQVTGTTNANRIDSTSINIYGGTANALYDAALYISQESSNDWAVTIEKNSWEYGITYNLATSHTYGIRGQKGGNEYWRVGTDLLYHNSNIRAPIFYDNDNTAYYGDFASSSNLYTLNVANYLSLSTGRAAAVHGYAGLFVSTQSAASNFTPFSFESTTGDHSWGQVARFRINTGGQDRPSIQFSSASTDNRWNIGYAAANDDFHIVQNMGYRNDNSTNDGWGTIRVTIDTSGNITNHVSTYSPIFYDSNDTAYYVDPNSRSNINKLTLANSNEFLVLGNADVSTTNQVGISWAGTTNPNYSIFKPAGAWIQPLHIAFHTGLKIGAQSAYSGTRFYNTELMVTEIFSVGNGDNHVRVAEIGYAGNSFRAPLFYDSDNTAYYVDAAGESRLNSLRIFGAANWDAITLSTDGANGYIQGLGDETGLHIRSEYGNVYLADNRGDVRMPMFYDVNDTAYYVDPNSISNLNTIRLSNSNLALTQGDGTGLRITTAYGYVNIGAQNASWTHVYSDKSFYTNQDWYVNNSLMHHDGNAPRARNSYLMYYQGFTLDANTMDHNATGFTYSVNAPWTGPIARFSTGGGYDLWLNAQYGGAGNGFSFRTRNGDAGTFNAWKAVLHDGNYNNYSPTLTGGGASGTWGINITGSAATATDSTKVAKTGDTMTGALNISASPSGRTLSLGGDQLDRVIDDSARSSLVINAAYYPHLYINATSNASNTNHGPVFSMSGVLSAGGYRRWGMGIANTDPDCFSWGYYDNNVNPHYGVGGTFGYTGTNSKMWLNTGGSLMTTGDMRAPIFYDSNDTTYYGDFASTSNLYNLQITGASNKYLYINPGNGYEAMVRYNGGAGSGWYAGKRVADQLVSPSDFHFYSEGAGRTVGGITAAGAIVAYGSVDSPKFYSTNRWGSANLSDLSSAPFEGGDFSAGTTAQYVPLTHQSAVYNSGYRTHVSTGTYKDANGWGGGWYMAIGGSDSYPTEAFQLRHGGAIRHTNGYVTIEGDTRSPTFYDSNDTSYYVNPNSVSNLYGLTLAGGSYFKPSNWIQFDSAYGLYWPNTNAAHIHGNDISSYGSIAIRGARNGWRGIYFHEGGYTPHYMLDGSGNGGLYHESSGRWANYYNYSNDCTGFGTSSTSSTFNVYATKGVYGARVDASYFYDAENTAYYADPAGTSVLNRISTVRTDNFLYMDNNYGHSIVGVYSSTVFQGVWAMGDAYKLPANGANTGNLYGLAWSHPNAGGVAANLNTHGLLAMENGTWLASLCGSTRARDDMRAPIFYDNNNTAYYLDPNTTGTSLNVAGSITAGGNITASSDIRLKEDIEVITNAIDKVKQITGVTYTRKENGKRQTGVIAQDVLKVLPEAVEGSDDSMYSVAYGNMVGLLIESIKEQQKTIESLTARIAVLEAK